MPITNIGLPTSFVPTSITGCSLWMDGADPAGTGTPPATGATVATWIDKSSNTSSTPTFSGGTAIYNNGVVFSSSSVSGTFISAPANAIYTSFTVMSAVTSTNGVFTLRNPGNNDEIRACCIIGGTNAFETANAPGGSWATILYNSTTFPLTNAIATSSNTATSIGITINGNTVSSNVSGTGYTLSTCSTWNISWNTATVSEIILYNSILSMDQRQQVEKYLAWKWKVPSKLPATHIGYKGPPVAMGKVPYYTAFSPLSIPTCALWADASDTSSFTFSSGSNISQWKDKSGTNNHFNAWYNPSVLTMDGGRRVVNVPNASGLQSQNQITFTTSSAFFLVCRVVQVGGNLQECLWLPGVNTNYGINFGGGGGGSLLAGTANGGGATSSDLGYGTYYVNGALNPSFDYTYYNNSYAIIDTLAPSQSGTSTIYFSSDNYSGNRRFNGNIAEFIYYPAGVTDSQRQQLESYLAQKWNLTTKLPVTHLNTTKPAGLPAAVPQVLLLFTALSSFMSTVYNLSGTYMLANIANTVNSLSATPAYIWTVAVPSNAKGKNGILAIFFNLYSATQFTTNQYFDYGIYVDGVAQMLGDSTGTIRYVQTAAGNYAMSSGGVSLGTNGLVNGFPLILPISFLVGASQIQIGLKNSLSAMTPVLSSSPGYSSNILTTTVGAGSNTSSYIPQNTFSTTGTSTYIVPTICSAGTVTGVYVYLWGCGGAANNTNAGGPGGYTSGFYSCAGGTTLTVVVGGLGGGSSSTGGGTTGGVSSGGGSSGIFTSGGVLQANAIAMAGGGGGACGSTSGGATNGASSGGAGGGSSGNGAFFYGYSYATGSASLGGSGGSQTTPGNSSEGRIASALVGGGSAGDSGGAGGGYWGGGGGGGGSSGGGGSGYIGRLTSSGYTVVGNQATAAIVSGAGSNVRAGGPYSASNGLYTASNSPYFPSGSAYGSGNGSTGLVVIVPAVGTNPVQVGVSATLYSG